MTADSARAQGRQRVVTMGRMTRVWYERVDVDENELVNK